MKNTLINGKLLERKLSDYKPTIQDSSLTFLKWHNDSQKEEALQTNFLNDIFGKVLGYEIDTGKEEFNLLSEYKTQKDGTKVDGVLGFITDAKKDIRIAIELKGKNTKNLDEVEKQAFEYRDKIDGIEWVIISNTNEIRLYSANSGGRLRYQSWNMLELANSIEKQKEFHFFLANARLFVEHGVSPLAKIIEENIKEEKEIKDKFYKEYKAKRVKLIDEIKALNSSIDAISKAQKLLDRILFIRFCIDRGYIAKNIVNTVENLIKLRFTFYQALKVLFETIDKGSNDDSLQAHEQVIAWNGGLFAEDTELNNLQIGSEILKEIDAFFKEYDFSSQIDVHILGHIFEQSISDLEKLKNGEEFDVKKGQRKKDGVFYTPEYITQYIVKEAVGGWLDDRKSELNEKDLLEITKEELGAKKTSKSTKEKAQKHLEFWKLYAEKLTAIKVVDPACGSGAFLVEVFNFLEKEWQTVNQKINYFAKITGAGSLLELNHDYKDTLKNNIYGVDINFESVQITRLSLWIQTAHHKTALVSLDENIKIGNSLIDNPAVCPKAFKWAEEFPSVFAGGGFDVVVGNPPYVLVQNLTDNMFQYFYKIYNVAQYKIDLYQIFIEKGLKLLKNNGYISHITPNTFLKNKHSVNLRKMILQKSLISVRLYNFSVFENVSVDTLVLVVKKNKNENDICRVDFADDVAKFESQDYIQSQWTDIISFSQNDIISKIEARSKLLKETNIKVYFGIQTHDRKKYVADYKRGDDWFEVIDGTNINKYSLSSSKEYVNFTDDAIKSGGKKEIYLQDRICVRQIGEYPIGTIVKSGIFTLNTIFNLYNFKDININYALLILNSRVIQYYWSLKFYDNKQTFPKIKKDFLLSLPIPQATPEKQAPLITHAQTMLTTTAELNTQANKFTRLLRAEFGIEKLPKRLKAWFNLEEADFLTELERLLKKDKKPALNLPKKQEWLEFFTTAKVGAQALQGEISRTDKEIDAMVYELYGLTEEEIKVVEGI